MHNTFAHGLLDQLEPISLDGLDRVKLLNRVDRKYIIPSGSLPCIIQLLSENKYSILEIDQRRAFNYKTTYFDTLDYRFYRDHHNGLSRRIKVRTRSYLESNQHFLEVKIKTNIRTKKLRQSVGQPGYKLPEIKNKKITAVYSKELFDSLVPTLTNSYTRITFVNSTKTERCTIDLNLSFRNPKVLEHPVNMQGIAIVEVKQSRRSVLTGIIGSLRTMQIHPSSISKYVLGIVLIHPEIKHNSFRPLLREINKTKTQQIQFP